MANESLCSGHAVLRLALPTAVLRLEDLASARMGVMKGRQMPLQALRKMSASSYYESYAIIERNKRCYTNK